MFGRGEKIEKLHKRALDQAERISNLEGRIIELEFRADMVRVEYVAQAQMKALLLHLNLVVEPVSAGWRLKCAGQNPGDTVS